MRGAFAFSSRNNAPADSVAQGREIQDFISTKPDRDKFNRFLDKKIPGMSLNNVTVLMRESSKSGIKINSVHLSKLTDIIKREPVAPNDELYIFSGLMYGLKLYPSNYDSIPALLSALRAKLQLGISSLDGQFFGTSVYGLQQMSADEPEVLALIDVLTQKIFLSRGEFDGMECGGALYGLKNMDNSSTAVNSFLDVMSRKLEASPDLFEPRRVCIALFGLQKMSHITPELEDIWVQLTTHLKRCQGPFTAQNIGNAYNSFASLKSFDSPVLWNLIRSLNSILSDIKPGKLDPLAIASVLEGLAGAGSSHEEVRAALACIAPHIQSCTQPFREKDLTRILKSMRNYSSDCKEVRAVVKAIAKQMASSKQFSLAQILIPETLYALRNLSPDEMEVEALLISLVKAIGPVKVYTTVSKMEHVYSGSDIALLLGGLKSISTDNKNGKILVRLILKLIGPVTNAPRGSIDWNTSAKGVLIALDSLRGKRLGSPLVPEQVALVAHIVKNCPAPASDFDPASLMRSMGFLQTLVAPPFPAEMEKAVQLLLGAASPILIDVLKVEPTDDKDASVVRRPLTGAELADMTSWLRGMDGSCTQLQTFLKVIKTYHRRLGEAPDVFVLCRHLSGMTNMDHFHPAVASLLSELVKTPPEPISDPSICREAFITHELLLALQGCRRLSAETPTGAKILRILAALSTHASSPVSDCSAVCAALAGLRGFADQLLNNAISAESSSSRDILLILNSLLKSIRCEDDSSDLISPLQYGCVLLTTLDFLPHYITAESNNNGDVISLLQHLERIVSSGNKSLPSWDDIIWKAFQQNGDSGDSSVVSKKRPPVTTSDLALLRQALHMALMVLGDLLVDKSGHHVDCLHSMRNSCLQSLEVVDPKHFSDNSLNTVDSEGSEDTLKGEIELQSFSMKSPGFTYAEMKHIKNRRRFRNFLAEDCLTRSRNLVAPKINPSVLGIFSTDIILSFDKNGSDLSSTLDLNLSMPYHHLLNPDIFLFYTSENSGSLCNVVLDIEKNDQIYSSHCGIDSNLMRKLKLRFLKQRIGDDMALILNPDEVKQAQLTGVVQYPAAELKKKKLLFYYVPSESFENMRTKDILSSITDALGSEAKPEKDVNVSKSDLE